MVIAYLSDEEGGVENCTGEALRGVIRGVSSVANIKYK
jgi:hypothetical protein